MTITISSATNEQIYSDVVDVARKLLALRNKCATLAERLYFIGVVNDGSVAVPGFVDAVNLTKADVAAGVSVILDTRDFVTTGRLQVLAQLLRNEPAF